MYFLSGKPRYFYSGVDSTVHISRRALRWASQAGLRK
jgi:hypothetical protein